MGLWPTPQHENGRCLPRSGRANHVGGPQYGDLTCLGFAKLLEREFQGFVPPPAASLTFTPTA